MNDTTMVQKAAEYLDGFHIDLSKYDAKVTNHEVTTTVRFTSRETQQSIYVDNCYCDKTEILQADIHF
jgi:hypothetical protein